MKGVEGGEKSGLKTPTKRRNTQRAKVEWKEKEKLKAAKQKR